MIPDILSPAFINSYKDKIAPFGFNGMGYFVYKRTYSRIKPDGNTEEWYETVGRCINGAQRIGAEYTKEEAERLFDHIFNLRCNYAGRMLWQLGTPTVEKYFGNSLLNCWFCSINEPKAFLFLFENLMLGGGVGFSIRREDVHELPRIKAGVKVEHQGTKDADFIVPDSRAGWVKILGKVLDAYYVTGKSFTYSTILVRGAGEPIKGFGGTASGPKILIEGIQKIAKILASREEKKLRSVDALDICNIIGSIVVAGNVRRSAEIALGDPDDYLYLRAKNWSLGNVPNWRAMSNNTIYADSYDHISDEIWSNGYMIDPKTGYAKGEPYGFFNLPLSQRYGRLKDGPIKDSNLYPGDKDNLSGTNPCIVSDTWVLTSDGPRQVKDLINSDLPLDMIHHGKAYQTLSHGFQYTGHRPTFKVKTRRGLVLTLTDNHKLLQSIATEQIWRELRELKIGDKIHLQQHTNYEWGHRDEANHGWLLGNLVGDGTFTDNRAILCYRGNDKHEMLTHAAGLVRDEIGGRSDLGTATCVAHDRMRLGSVELKRFAEEYGIYQNAKYDLSLIERTSSSFHEGFLRGLFDADGSVQGSQEKGVSVRLSSSSLSLLGSCQRMLARLGVLSTIYENRRDAGTRSLPDGRGGYKDYPCQAQHELVVVKDNVIRYAKRVGFQDPVKTQTLADLIAAYRRSPYHDRFIDEIVSIEPAGLQDVYDVTVDVAHAFDANGIVSHNCGEISLASYECCNLSELYLNNIRSKDELIDCAKLLYKTQKAISAMPFLHKETEEIVHKNMRLGLGVTGICQSFDKIEWLDDCYVELRKFDKEWSKKRGWPASIKLTTIKPSGTLSLLGGATPGVHPAYSQFYIRRVRVGSNDKLVEICRRNGYNVEYAKNFDGSENRDTVIVEFPCETPVGAVLAKDMSVIKQLDMVAKLQSIWSDNAVSVTAYYDMDELPVLKSWLEANYEKSIKSVSFLLRDKHGFQQAPYEEITEEQYREMIAKIKPLAAFNEDVGNGTLAELECAGGACPIR
jgi:ribonucleotide reductase class II